MVTLFNKFPIDDPYITYTLDDIPKICPLGRDPTQDRAQASWGVPFDSTKELQQWLKKHKITITDTWEGIFI